MGRTFFFGAYKYPRELNWVIVVLLVLTLAMGLTGYLRLRPALLLGHGRGGQHQRLRADRRSLPGRFPPSRRGIRAHRSRASTRCTCYTAGLMAALIGAHLYLVAKLGTTAPPWLKAEKKDLLTEEI